MRVHLNNVTSEILGYYPEEIEYPNLPPESEMQTITEEEHRQALNIIANVWTADGPKVDESLHPIPELAQTPEEKLSVLGLTKDDLKALLA